MGYNIAGIVIDKNYQNHLSELKNIIGEELIFEKEVIFEEACESFKDSDYCDIYFTPQGTFILMSFEKAGFPFYDEGKKVLSFVFSEMTMCFSINYSENGTLLRNFFIEEDRVLEDDGEPFDFEKEEDFNPELIYHLIEKTLGKSFWDIDIAEKCYRYRFGNDAVPEIQETKSEKPWWKFW